MSMRGKRIERICDFGGSLPPLNPSTRYTVAMPEYLMTGREANMPFLTRTHALIGHIEDLRDIRQALIAELSAKFPVKLPQ